MQLYEMTAGILAGGKSSRMGKNKARLHLEGETKSFLERIAAQMQEFSDILVSVNSREAYADLPWTLAEDEIDAFGPVEGLYQLLRTAKTVYTLIVATDMPFLQRELFAAMADRLRAEAAGSPGDALPDCLILRVGGKLEPLCSIYGKRCLPALERMRQEEQHKIRFLYDQVHTAYVDLETLGLPAELVQNINTAAEFSKACAQRRKA